MTRIDLAHRFDAMVAELEQWARSYRVPPPDMLVHAWQHLIGATDPKRCTVPSLAYYAAKRCRRRHCGRDILTHPTTCGLRVPFDDTHTPPRLDHTEIIALAEQWAQWLETLTDRDREIIAGLARGDQAYQVATGVGISPGRLTQIRQHLRGKWQAYCE